MNGDSPLSRFLRAHARTGTDGWDAEADEDLQREEDKLKSDIARQEVLLS